MSRKILTSRDLEVIKFLEQTNLLITADQASRMFYWTKNKKSSLNIAQRRLQAAVELKQINRYRDYVNQSYVYYLERKPKGNSFDHKLMITEFLVHLSQEFEIIDIKTEFKGFEKDYNIRPDIFVTFRMYDKIFSALVECDNTKEFTNGEAYTKISKDKRSGKLKDILPYTTLIISCCKKQPIEKVLWVNSDFSNFSSIKNKLVVATEKKK